MKDFRITLKTAKRSQGRQSPWRDNGPDVEDMYCIKCGNTRRQGHKRDCVEVISRRRK